MMLNVSPKTQITSLIQHFGDVFFFGRYPGSKEIFGGGTRQLAGWMDRGNPRTNERSGTRPTLLRIYQPSAEAALHPESCRVFFYLLYD